MNIRKWWQERRYGPLTPDRCETCRRPLRERQRVEVASGIDYSSEFMGHSAMLVPYCKKDAPRPEPQRPNPANREGWLG